MITSKFLPLQIGNKPLHSPASLHSILSLLHREHFDSHRTEVDLGKRTLLAVE